MATLLRKPLSATRHACSLRSVLLRPVRFVFRGLTGRGNVAGIMGAIVATVAVCGADLWRCLALPLSASLVSEMFFCTAPSRLPFTQSWFPFRWAARNQRTNILRNRWPTKAQSHLVVTATIALAGFFSKVNLHWSFVVAAFLGAIGLMVAAAHN